MAASICATAHRTLDLMPRIDLPPNLPSGIHETTTHGVLLKRAALTPHLVAMVENRADAAEGRSWTYGQLRDDAARLALALLSRFDPGERIAVWSSNCPEWVILQFAASFAGLTLVTVNPSYQARELEYVIAGSGAVGLFIRRNHRGHPMAEIARDVASANGNLREVVDLTEPSQLYEKRRSVDGLPEVLPGDPAQIQYSAGITGPPKGVVLHHRGLTNVARTAFEAAGVRRGDTALHVMPMFHLAGCGALTLGAVQLGCRTVVMDDFDPQLTLDVIEREAANVILAAPSLWSAMVQAQEAKARQLASVRVALSGGSVVPAGLVHRIADAFNCRLLTAYGQTETSGVLTMVLPTDNLADLCETVGRPVPGVEISIRVRNSDDNAPAGAVGEIFARGYPVMIGYCGETGETESATTADGWLRTGDLGTLDERGYLRITGRVHEVITRGGETVFPAQIERVLADHPTVAEAAVVGVPDSHSGEAVAAFIRPVAGAHMDRHTLISHCRARLSGPSVPTYWIEVESRPSRPSAAIQKHVLREQYFLAPPVGAAA